MIDTEFELLIALANSMHSDCVIFKTEDAAMIHSTLEAEDHDHIESMIQHLPNGIYRLEERSNCALGDLVHVSEQDAIASLVAAGLIGPATVH